MHGLHTPLVGACLALLPLAADAQRERCGAPQRHAFVGAVTGQPSDCGYFTNSPEPQYEPDFYYDVPVVFHVIQNTSGEGFLDAQTIRDQIDVLNEDFQALPGSAGAPGTDSKIRFHLAQVDPSGSPTTGITYTTNNSWYQDSGAYWNTLAWDPHRYLNIYTNSPPCCYGYVPDYAQAGGLVGEKEDRVVVWWEAVGKEPTAGWPENQGRTATHELGHYFGLYHTFDDGCGSASACYSTGDLICDTEREDDSTLGCPASKSSCGSPDPIHNYMDYTDDPCLWEFTPEQVNRMRCTLEHWRPDVFLSVPAQESVRLGTPPNPSALLPGQSSGPLAASVWDPVVDHTAFEPSAVLDLLVVSTGPLELDLGLPGTLLCNVPFTAVVQNAAPGDPFAVPIPNNGSLLGLALCAQAVSTSDGVQYALTNALDITIGNL